MEKVFTKNDIEKLATDLISKLAKLKNTGATVVALSGELGSGKTTLTKEIGRLLGIPGVMASPTFVIMKKYNLVGGKYSWKNLIHIDAYRLESSQELLKLGWQELRENKDNLIIVEWPEKVPECLTGAISQIILGHKGDEARTFEILL
jgi:tRNA threonylcarbamoyladenosine biosynthesis protein TsaE